MSDSVWPHRRQSTRIPIPGILQARKLEWVAISFSNAWKWKVKVKSLSRVWLFTTPWTAAYQAPPSMGFSRQEYWSRVPLPSSIWWIYVYNKNVSNYVVVQSLSHVWIFATPWTAACQASLSFTISLSLLKLISTESMMPSNHLILCHPLLLLPSIFPSIRVFSHESALHIKWPKYWSFNFSIIPSNEYSGLFSFKIDWVDLLAVPGTLKSLLQYHSLKASVLQCSAFFMVQLSYRYMTAGKTIALTR